MAHPSEVGDNAASDSLEYLHIPNMLADWPWQRKINPFYEEVAAEGDAWLRTYLPFNPKSYYAFDRCKIGLCAALMFPDVPAEQFRTSVDVMNVFFLIDEYTDVEPAPRVREIVDICADALHNPSKPRPDGEVILGEVIRQVWRRGQKTIAHQNEGHFVASFIDYLHSVEAHAEARDNGAILTAKAQRAIRCKDIGAEPLYALWGAFHSIPDHLYNNRLHVRMVSLGCELIAMDNDFVSYSRERASGTADFNMITITMYHDGLNLKDAALSLVQQNAKLAAEYIRCHRELYTALAVRGEGDEASLIRRYLDHMGGLRRANWCWSFECGRYFGERGSTYAETQMVPLIPKIMRDTDLHEDQIDVVLMEEQFAKL